MNILKSFYAKVWNEENTYYIKYEYYCRKNDDIYYRVQLELDDQKIPKDCGISRISVWTGFGETIHDIPLIFKKCHSLGIWENRKGIFHVYYQDYNDTTYSGLKYNFKYLGEFKGTDDPEEVKLLIECGVEE